MAHTDDTAWQATRRGVLVADHPPVDEEEGLRLKLGSREGPDTKPELPG